MDDPLAALLRRTPLSRHNGLDLETVNSDLGSFYSVTGLQVPGISPAGVNSHPAISMLFLFQEVLGKEPHPLFPNRDKAFRLWFNCLEPIYRQEVIAVDSGITQQSAFTGIQDEMLRNTLSEALAVRDTIPSSLLPGMVRALGAGLPEATLTYLCAGIMCPEWVTAYRCHLMPFDS